jgi:hypothetical protein
MEAEGGEGAREFMAMLEIFRCRMYTRIIRNQLQAAVTLFSETACCQIMTAVESAGVLLFQRIINRGASHIILCNLKSMEQPSRYGLMQL